MRLIYAEALTENIVKAARDLRTLSTKTVGQAIDQTPTVDAVPVIRCRDCIRNGTPDCAMEYHYLDSDWRFNDYSWNNENDFCSYGERKKE